MLQHKVNFQSSSAPMLQLHQEKNTIIFFGTRKMLTNITTNWGWKKNLNLKLKKIKVWFFSKKSCSSINLLCFSIIAKFFSKNSAMALSFKGPSHPTQASLGQFLTMKMNQSKFSIPSLDHLKLEMTLVTLKICSISIYDPTMSSIWWVRNETWGNWTTCFAHQIKGFSISIGCTTNRWYNCNSLFKVDMITSSFDRICPKNKSSPSITIGWYIIVALTGFKWKNTYN